MFRHQILRVCSVSKAVKHDIVHLRYKKENDVLQNPEFSPTANSLQSSLKLTERATVVLGLSMGGLVFILTRNYDKRVSKGKNKDS